MSAPAQEWDSTIVSAIIVGIPTAILAILTFFYMWETRKMRQNQERPNFALEPTTYSIGGDIHRLALINEGQTANDLKIDVSWGEQEQEKLKLYCISLSKGSMMYLEKIPLGEIKQNNKKISVKITCKDTNGKNYNSELALDFAKIIKDSREVAFQYDSDQSVTNSLSSISREISSMERVIGNLSHSLSRLR